MLDLCGTVPIPPYLGRSATDRDRDSYGTVYCKHSGSVAAPTAGLHFSKSVFSSLTVKRILRSSVTLHVGAGTFKPVRSETIGGHVMHSEWFSVNRGLVVRLLENEGRIVAAGTTSVRTLESLYHIGASLFADPGFNPESFSVGQWSPYGVDGCGFRESFSSVLDYMDRNGLSKLSARTSILIAPGYRFRVVSGMITNFHQPRSTLLLLVSAFTGGAWREIYDHALARNYRFLSYGDTSLLLP
jgi:S-adenosylmethionine:tRNA ribosyltransferase-isomerase